MTPSATTFSTPTLPCASAAGSSPSLVARFAVHDRKQLEIKLDYTIDPKHKQNTYGLEAYFFLPRSLGIDAQSYPREAFYKDLQNYVRYKTPAPPLARLLDPDNEKSPLGRMARLSKEAVRSTGRNNYAKRLSHECRLFGCQLRSLIRDNVQRLCVEISGLRGRSEEHVVLTADLRASLNGFRDGTDKALGRFRELRPQLLHHDLPDNLQQTFQAVDEYLSLEFERSLAHLVQTLDSCPGLRRELGDSREALVASLGHERGYRLSAGYPGMAEEAEAWQHQVGVETGSAPAPDPQERYLFHLGSLKKLVMSVLFLDIQREREGRHLAEFLAGCAAGFAMLISTVAALVWQDMWSVNGLQLVLGLCVIYIFKDRIKDMLKRFFSRRLSSWLWDYSVRIRDLEFAKTVGRCRETVGFIPRDRVPALVLQRRLQNLPFSHIAASANEAVLHYGREIRLFSRSISKLHGRLHDINDIIRLHVSSFLQRMDDPLRLLPSYDAEHDAVTQLKGSKTYVVDVVFVLRDGRSALRSMQRVRLVLDKTGIRRLISSS